MMITIVFLLLKSLPKVLKLNPKQKTSQPTREITPKYCDRPKAAIKNINAPPSVSVKAHKINNPNEPMINKMFHQANPNRMPSANDDASIMGFL